MSSTLPIVEEIALTIAACLEGVEGIESVVRPVRFGGYTPKDGLAVLLQADPERLDTEALGLAEWRQPFEIMLFVVPSDESAEAVDALINALRADVEKALMASPQWGGLAVDSRVTGAEYFDAASGRASGITLTLAVHYRTLEGDPYSQG